MPGADHCGACTASRHSHSPLTDASIGSGDSRWFPRNFGRRVNRVAWGVRSPAPASAREEYPGSKAGSRQVWRGRCLSQRSTATARASRPMISGSSRILGRRFMMHAPLGEVRSGKTAADHGRRPLADEAYAPGTGEPSRFRVLANDPKFNIQFAGRKQAGPMPPGGSAPPVLGCYANGAQASTWLWRRRQFHLDDQTLSSGVLAQQEHAAAVDGDACD